jgi:AcrR family transcriptional regulator
VKTSFSVAGKTVMKRPRGRSATAGGQGSVAEVDGLLAAAEAVLTTQGYAGLRVDDVLDEAGLSTRAFYRHFRGKSELFVALFDREMTRAQQRLRAKLVAAPTHEAKVETWVVAMLALAYDRRLARRTQLFLVERQVIAREFPEEIARCIRMMLEPLEAAIKDGLDTGAFPNADPSRDALAIHHLCTGLMTDRLLGIGGGLNRDEAEALATRFALTTLRGGA